VSQKASALLHFVQWPLTPSRPIHRNTCMTQAEQLQHAACSADRLLFIQSGKFCTNIKNRSGSDRNSTTGDLYPFWGSEQLPIT